MIIWNNNDYRSFIEPLNLADGESYILAIDPEADDGKACVIFGKKQNGKIIQTGVEFL